MTASPAERVLEAALLDLIQAYPELLEELREEFPELSLRVGAPQGTFPPVPWLAVGAVSVLAVLGLGGVGIVLAIVALGFGMLAVLRSLASRPQAEDVLNLVSVPGGFATEQDPFSSDGAEHQEEVVAESFDADEGVPPEHVESFEGPVAESLAAEDAEPSDEPVAEPIANMDTEPLEAPLDALLEEPLAQSDAVPLRTVARESVQESPALHGTATAVGIQQDDDPLTEADFHIGYGMYDQAAELLRAAIEHEPTRRELRLKLLDVYFESGNRNEFQLVAEELVRTRYLAGPGEREKIGIMGRQIAPKSPLFADSEDVGMATGMGLDLNLENGDLQVDYEVISSAPAEQRSGSAGDSGPTLQDITPALESYAGAETLADDEMTFPVSMSEVGVKLDLARAYVNLGDPAGARSILEEVLNEGSVEQKQEAQQLLETLPG